MIDIEKTNLPNCTKEQLIEMLVLAWSVGEDNQGYIIERDNKIEELRELIKRKDEALRFYAKDKSWEETHCYCGTSTARTIVKGVIHRSDIDESGSGGITARNGLSLKEKV